MCGTDLVDESNFDMGKGITPRPVAEGLSAEDVKRTCIPMQIPKYGRPEAM
jgi:hypothetical protein